MDSYEQKLLLGWEDIYKRGLLTFWILLSLVEEPKYMAEIRQFIENQSRDSFAVEDQSLYRALRRYVDSEMITFSTRRTSNGPDRKYYELTSIGRRVLTAFTKRNIAPLQNQYTAKLII